MFQTMNRGPRAASREPQTANHGRTSRHWRPDPARCRRGPTRPPLARSPTRLETRPQHAWLRAMDMAVAVARVVLIPDCQERPALKNVFK